MLISDGFDNSFSAVFNFFSLHYQAKIDNVISSGGIVASKDVSPARGGSAGKTASSGVDPVYAKSKNVRLKSKEELAAEKAGDQNKKQILKEGLGTALTP